MPDLIHRFTGLHRARSRSFHDTERSLIGVNGPGVQPDNEAGVIGWGTWRMQGYLLMAERTGRQAYAERLAGLIDQVLEARDHVRGVCDFRGRSLPVWSTAGKFTAASVVLNDTEGRPALEVSVCPPHAKAAKVAVEVDGDRHFRITVSGPNRRDFTVAGLSLDPLDDRRADRAVYAAYEQRSGVTARLVLPDGPSDGPRRIHPGTFTVRPAMVSLSAQTGMITYPMAGLARLAREHPDAVPASVRRRIDDYLDAVDRALRVHDEQWGTTDDGRGFYRWLPDEPVSFAGAELPTNEFLAMGRTTVQLAVVTGDELWRERAAAMARALHGDLTIADGVADWPYWPGFGRVYQGWQATGSPKTDGSEYRPPTARSRSPRTSRTPSSTSTSSVCTTTPPACRRSSGRPTCAVANTFTRNVVERRNGAWRVRHDVGGAGRRGTDHEQAHVAAWLPMRRWNRDVTRYVRAIRPAAPPLPLMGVDTYCAALLTRWG